MLNHALTLTRILLHHITEVENGNRVADWDYINAIMESPGWNSAIALILPDDISFDHLCEAVECHNSGEALKILKALDRKLLPSHRWFQTFEELKAFYYQFVKMGKNPNFHRQIQKFFSGNFPHKDVKAPHWDGWDVVVENEASNMTNLECILENFEPQEKSA